MYKKLIRSFIIGSSIFVLYRHFNGFKSYILSKKIFTKLKNKDKFKKFYNYVLIATLYYGLINSLITFLVLRYNFNIHKTYLFFSIFLPSLMIIHNLYLELLWKRYKFNITESFKYIALMYYLYFINFNFIIKTIEIYFQ